MFKVFFHYRQLLIELTKREIKSRYKQSILGYAWVILNPFFQMVVMAFVLSMILKPPNIGVPYAIYLYAALLPWTLFANSLQSTVSCLVNNSALITKIYFPREVFVVSTILAKLVDFGLASTIFIFFLWWFHVQLSWHILWVIPILLIQLLFTYGIGLFLAAFNLFYRDIQYLLTLIITIWMYLTPVMYPVELFPDKYRFLFQLNPMAVLINAYRQVILAGSPPNFISLGIALLLSLTIFGLAYLLFKKWEGSFADNI